MAKPPKAGGDAEIVPVPASVLASLVAQLEEQKRALTALSARLDEMPKAEQPKKYKELMDQVDADARKSEERQARAQKKDMIDWTPDRTGQVIIGGTRWEFKQGQATRVPRVLPLVLAENDKADAEAARRRAAFERRGSRDNAVTREELHAE